MNVVLKQNTTVTELNIHSEKKKKKGEKIRNWSEVIELLTDNAMGDEGAFLLRDALKENTILAILDLEGNQKTRKRKKEESFLW